MSYNVGDIATVTITFTDADGAPVDPTTVTLTVQAPDGTETVQTYDLDAQPTKTSPGNYAGDITLSAPGTWHYRLAGTGIHQAAESGQIIAGGDSIVGLDPAVTGGYTTVKRVEAMNAGRPLTEVSKPSAEQAAGFIIQTAAELNTIVAGLGIAAPIPTMATISYGLMDYYNTLGAHCLVEESAPTSKMKDHAREMWEAAKQALQAGDIEFPDAPGLPGSQPRSNPARTPWFDTCQTFPTLRF